MTFNFALGMNKFCAPASAPSDANQTGESLALAFKREIFESNQPHSLELLQINVEGHLACQETKQMTFNFALVVNKFCAPASAPSDAGIFWVTSRTKLSSQKELRYGN